MKKQILFLAMFTLALIFVSIKSYGQVTYTQNLTGTGTIYSPTAAPITCATENELQPLPGKVYTYSVNVGGGAPPTGTKILWFVTDQSAIISAPATAGPAAVIQPTRDVVGGNYVLTATAPYNDVNNTSASVNISWKSFDGNAKQVLLVAHVTDAAGCTNNVQVYRIKPSFAFTLDIAAILDNGAVGNSECVSNVESASYDGTNLTMNYGENWVFFSVNAANFVHSWMPEFSVVSYTGGGSTAAVPVADIKWAYPANAKSNGATDWNAVTVPVLTQATGTGGAVGTTGENIIVRVRIDHANNENLTTGVLTFGVNGTMYDPAALAAAAYSNPALKDLDAPTAPAAACDNGKMDQATYDLTPRPAVTTNTGSPVLNFVPKN